MPKSPDLPQKKREKPALHSSSGRLCVTLIISSFFFFDTSKSANGLINLLYGSGADGDYHKTSSDSFIVPDLCPSQCVSLKQELRVNFRVDDGHELKVVN